ncbi:hypothetical protein TWF694_011848 [Orbilia ellipsospora]|uniref:F-box domain-containing protein n=1 Tax=Orbilia ellipsospora TaxID=2528407 RepID=A0AAV9X928_9PEZI
MALQNSVPLPVSNPDCVSDQKINKPPKIITKTPGLSRRHTVSSADSLKVTARRKRRYLESYDSESERECGFPTPKIAKKSTNSAHTHQPGQKTELLDLPSELLAAIIVFAIESPRHNEYLFGSNETTSPGFGPVRRWTTGNSNGPQESIQLDINSIFSPISQYNYHETSPYKDEALYPSRMLNTVAGTCHKLRRLVRLKEWDVQFWKPAARFYYHITYYPKVLPDSLDLIQGFLPTNQTSWRNFLTCTVHYIDTKRKGVESFGTKAGCKPSISWKDHQSSRQLHGTRSQLPNLLMLCRQPGPDLFDISWDASTESYTIAMGLNGGKYYASVDKKGEFTSGSELPRNLMRSVRGLFPADILEDKNDRFSIFRICSKGCNYQDTTATDNLFRSSHTFQETIRWDLSCVLEVRQDDKARIARCASWGNFLCFTLFKQNFADPTAPYLDPQEDSMVYCIKATEIEHGPDQSNNGQREFKSELVWSHKFARNAGDTAEGKRREPAVCHVALSSSYAAILLRWNNTSVIKHIVDEKRQLYIWNIHSGENIRCFNLPPFEWDFRHSDMGEEYNQIRLDKLRALYDDTNAVHRATRVHDDKIVVIEYDPPGNSEQKSAKIITGSHDYCNWVWDLNQTSDTEPSLVLDDFYWDTDTRGQQEAKENKNKWNKFKERAGWWCSTPNQVLDFWHDFSITPDGRFFGATRAGRAFLWDLSEERPTIKGYASDVEEEEPSVSDPKASQSLERYLGRPTAICDLRHGHNFLRWFEYKKRIPEEGLWMVFDDWSVIYLDRKDILEACGVSHRGWIFSRHDFESINTDSNLTRPPTATATADDGEEIDSGDDDDDMDEY